MKGLLIKVDGTETDVVIDDSDPHNCIEEHLNARSLDTVNLRNGTTMYVDDNGWETKVVTRGNHTTLQPTKARKPINEKATKLYHSVCRPGTTHQIVGDVMVIAESEWRNYDRARSRY